MRFSSHCSPVAQRLAVLLLPASLVASPPALLCSALLQEPTRPCPLLHRLPFPGRPEEREAQRHPTRILRSASSAIRCATAASSLTQDVFFVSGSSIPPERPWERVVGWRSWSPPKEGAWSQGCRHQVWGGFGTRALGTGRAWLVHSLASARAYMASGATCCACDFCL